MIIHSYYSNSGRNLIYEYIDSLSIDESDGHAIYSN